MRKHIMMLVVALVLAAMAALPASAAVGIIIPGETTNTFTVPM